MKKKILFASMLLITSMASAHVVDSLKIEVPEPEFEQEAILLTSNTEGIPLPVEHSSLKTTQNIGLALIGVNKINNYYQLDGPMSAATLDTAAYRHDMYIILSWSDNKRSPKRLLQIVPLEIQKKRRIYNVGTTNDFTGVATENRGYVNYSAEKYGEHSYLIKIPKSELQKLRDDDLNELKEFGKQYLIRLVNASTDKLSDTEDFITFGIERLKRK